MSTIEPTKTTLRTKSRSGSSRLITASGILAIIGLIVAGYMSYTSLTASHLVCAGLGDCNAVQASIFAKLLGVPVSVLGLISYAVIAVLLVGHWRLPGSASYIAGLGVLVVSLSGMVFSLFLTYAEVSIIHAVCPWCLTSAVVITLLAFLSLVRVFRELFSPTAD